MTLFGHWDRKVCRRLIMNLLRFNLVRSLLVKREFLVIMGSSTIVSSFIIKLRLLLLRRHIEGPDTLL